MKKEDQFLKSKIEEHEEFVARSRSDLRVDKLTAQDRISFEIASIRRDAELKKAEKEAEAEIEANNVRKLADEPES